MEAKLRQIPYYGTLALLAYMPFHIFISQWFSTFTGGLELWKGAKDALTFVLLLVSVVLIAWRNKNSPKAYWYLVGAGLVYGLLHVVLYLINQDTSRNLAGLATAYNCRLFAYAIIGWSALLLSPERLQSRKIVKLILTISTIVCILGLLQYLLPKDAMTHFGYSVERGVKPAFFIDDKPDLPRVMSTLRDPNSLAAFLAVPITLLWGYIITNKAKQRYLLLFGLLGIHLLTLVLTFSRGGLIGTLISLVVITAYLKKEVMKQWFKRFGLVLVAGALVLFAGGFLLRDQYFVQHVIFHSDESTQQADSNDLHASFVKEGLDGIAARPLGHGPGTAGIVSIQKADGGQLTENYFVQIGYEVGVLGLLLFLLVLGTVEKHLFSIRKHPLAPVLFATFWGYMFMAMVAHLWTNEAVAVMWWLPAGLVLASVPSVKRQKRIVRDVSGRSIAS